MKLYDQVKSLLEKYPELRNSDMKLLWSVWYMNNLVVNGQISRENFYKANSPESITRARRKVQELNEHLSADKDVKLERDKKKQEKGTFIFREQTKLL